MYRLALYQYRNSVQIVPSVYCDVECTSWSSKYNLCPENANWIDISAQIVVVVRWTLSKSSNGAHQRRDRVTSQCDLILVLKELQVTLAISVDVSLTDRNRRHRKEREALIHLAAQNESANHRDAAHDLHFKVKYNSPFTTKQDEVSSGRGVDKQKSENLPASRRSKWEAIGIFEGKFAWNFWKFSPDDWICCLGLLEYNTDCDAYGARDKGIEWDVSKLRSIFWWTDG